MKIYRHFQLKNNDIITCSILPDDKNVQIYRRLHSDDDYVWLKNIALTKKKKTSHQIYENTDLLGCSTLCRSSISNYNWHSLVLCYTGTTHADTANEHNKISHEIRQEIVKYLQYFSVHFWHGERWSLTDPN